MTEAVLETARAYAALGNLTGVSTAMATVGAGQPLSSAMPVSQRLPSLTSLSLGISAAQPAREAQPPLTDLLAYRRLPVNAVRDSEEQRIIKSIDEKYGILSLTTLKDNLLMWAHYSAAHTGAVIGIDIEDSNFVQGNGGFQKQRKVEYKVCRPELPRDEEVLMKHFFTKSIQWEYEKEYRIVRLLENATATEHRSSGYDIVLFNLPPSCIKELIFGARCNPETKEQIRDTIHKSAELKDISLWRANVSRSNFELTFETYQ